MNSIEIKKGNKYCIISHSWLRRWKNYINFKKYNTDNTFQEEEDQDKNFMEEETSEDRNPPFPVCSNEDILLDVMDYFPDIVDTASNTILKKGLLEGKDFHFVNQSIGELIHKNYGGIMIARESYTPESSSLAKIDVGCEEVKALNSLRIK